MLKVPTSRKRRKPEEVQRDPTAISERTEPGPEIRPEEERGEQHADEVGRDQPSQRMPAHAARGLAGRCAATSGRGNRFVRSSRARSRIRPAGSAGGRDLQCSWHGGARRRRGRMNDFGGGP